MLPDRKALAREALGFIYSVANAHGYYWGRRGRQKGRQRLLLVDTRVPDPTFGSGHPRARMIYDELNALGYVVDFYTTASSRYEVSKFARSIKGSLFICGRSNKLERFIRSYAHRYKAVIISRPPNMRLLHRNSVGEYFLKSGSCSLIYDAEAVWALRNGAQSDIDQEIELAGQADLILAVSEKEAKIFSARFPNKARVLGQYSFAYLQKTSLPSRNNLLFIGRMTGGARDSPNVASLVWFIDEVMPVLDGEIGTSYHLQLAGVLASSEIRERLSARVRHVGTPEDLSDLYASSRVFIVPTMTAAGLPTKLIDACAAGLPCVATPLTIKQVGFVSGEQILEGDTPAAFARSCGLLYTDDDLWMRIREKAVDFVGAKFSRDAFHAQLRQAMAFVGNAASVAASASERLDG